MIIEDTIFINVPQEIVWDVTEDIDSWSQWIPSIESIEIIDKSEFKIGSSAWIKQPQLPRAKWVVTDIEAGKYFTWKTKIRGMYMTALHELTTVTAGTENHLRLEVSGFVPLLLWPFIRSSIKRTLIAENQGLKERCEERKSVLY